MSLHPARSGNHLVALLGTLAIVALAAVNCDPDTGPNPSARITLSATVDGATWQASTPKHGVPPYANWYP